MSELKRKMDDMTGAAAAMPWIQQNIIQGLKGGPVVVTLGRETRSNPQNSLLWALLTDISNQVTWFDKKHSPDAWKDIITGSFRGAEFVPNITVGQNGFIWISGSKVEDELFAKKAILYVAENSLMSGLTDEMKNWFVEEKK